MNVLDAGQRRAQGVLRGFIPTENDRCVLPGNRGTEFLDLLDRTSRTRQRRELALAFLTPDGTWRHLLLRSGGRNGPGRSTEVHVSHEQQRDRIANRGQRVFRRLTFHQQLRCRTEDQRPFFQEIRSRFLAWQSGERAASEDFVG